ncbi:MAG: hypothetical protein HYT15_01850 [Candidatus Magasanikbacteria bacterium]|nr:hypothetical protein [Candidatus Magasanikbacteria bacterium]
MQDLQQKVKSVPKKYIYGGLAVLLFIIVLAFALKDKNGSEDQVNPDDLPAQEDLTLTESTTSTTSTTSATKKPATPVKTPLAPLSATQRYLDAIKIYKTSGYYFQFVDCHGLPGSLTLKKGKKFMLDNRDAKSRKIAIQGGQSFTIGAYNFAIATAPTKPGVHYITCDGGGAASILVQQ